MLHVCHKQVTYIYIYCVRIYYIGWTLLGHAALISPTKYATLSLSNVCSIATAKWALSPYTNITSNLFLDHHQSMKLLKIKNLRMLKFRMIIVLGLVLLATTASSNIHAGVMNRLGSGKSMTLHCQSKDNDLGQQIVEDGGEFGWDFAVNVIGTTLFFCDLGWESVGEFHFDAFSFGRDFVRCESECLWIVAEEGVYGLNGQTGFWEYAYPWSTWNLLSLNLLRF